MREFGDVVFVGDQDDSVAVGLQAIHQGHDFVSGLGVEVAGGFVGEDDRRTVYEGAGDGDSLALSAGKFVGFVHHAGFHADRCQRVFGALHALFAGDAGVNQRQLDVVQGGGAGQQIESLEANRFLLRMRASSRPVR